MESSASSSKPGSLSGSSACRASSVSETASSRARQRRRYADAQRRDACSCRRVPTERSRTRASDQTASSSAPSSSAPSANDTSTLSWSVPPGPPSPSCAGPACRRRATEGSGQRCQHPRVHAPLLVPTGASSARRGVCAEPRRGGDHRAHVAPESAGGEKAAPSAGTRAARGAPCRATATGSAPVTSSPSTGSTTRAYPPALRLCGGMREFAQQVRIFWRELFSRKKN